jgi:hypothetical protein
MQNAGLPFRFSKERKVQTFSNLMKHLIPSFLLQICDEGFNHQLGIKFRIKWTPFVYTDHQIKLNFSPGGPPNSAATLP